MPRFAIVNTIDSPCPSMVAEWVDGIGYCYMARAEEPNLKRYDGMHPTRPTAMEDFGFAVLVRGNEATFAKVKPSIAHYDHCGLRRWQGDLVTFALPLVGKVRRRKRVAHA